MTDDTLSKFLESLHTSGIVPADRVDTLSAEWADTSMTGPNAAEGLVDSKLLTAFQARKLLADEGSSLLIAQRYEIRELLGSGGMGDVYLARDRQLDRLVAIKILPMRLVRDADAVARFEREAKAMARLSHPNIVQAHDAGSDGDRHFLVMEFIEGVNLSKRLKEQGTIPPPIAADYAYQAAIGLEHAHRKGLVHRDLKPSNLLVSAASQGVHPPGSDLRLRSTHDPSQKNQPDYAGRSPQEVIKILDLGLARFLQDQIDDETITVAGTGLGTPDYMAPEQFDNAHNADERSDIYALGCTLYHMLTGRVPFPGSSLSEKQRDHQQTQPEALEQHCPLVPAGLAAAVQKMMAKRPSDRFQSARECSEALLPYVAVSSGSLPDIQNTADWEGSRLTILTSEVRRRRSVKWIGYGSLVALISLFVGFGLSKMWNSPPPPGDSASSSRRSGKTLAKKTGLGISPIIKKQAELIAKYDPWVLTVAKDGSGEFKSIADALDNASPGVTIDVIDNAVYTEQLPITDPKRHAGITITTHSGAVLEFKTHGYGILIRGVPDVCIRGFIVSGGPNTKALISVEDKSPGTRLQNLNLRSEWKPPNRLTSCIALTGLNLSDDDEPVMVLDCRIQTATYGIRINGLFDYTTPRKCRRIIIRNNSIEDAYTGILVIGLIQQLQIVGNMIIAPDSPVNRAMQFEKLMEGTGQIVVANNTLWNTGSGVRIWDALVLSRDVRFCNNLFLGLRDDDFVIVGAPETVNAGFPPGDVKSLLARWKFDRNWRRERTSKPDGKRGSWIPPTSRDEKYKTVRILSRNPSSPDFLRPAAKSPLATEGAGKTDPSLPIYVGAVPPKGTPAWDWDRTWRMPPGKHSVLTVSKDTEDGAQYDSINDALKVAKPWDTIRVLDAAIYSEHIVLDDPAKHAGLVLESAKGATIRLAPGSTRVLEIWGVPHVRVTGFRLDGTAEGLLINHVRILNHAPGVILEGLTIQAANPSRAILIQNVAVARTEEPLVVRNCIIEPMQADDQLDGITIVGPLAGAGADATGGILIQNNRVAKARRGILLVGELRDVHVVGNRVWKAAQAGMQFEDLHHASRGILLANNTAFDCLFGVRIWDNSPYESFTSGQVQISNNLLQSTVGNMRFVLFGSGKNSAGDGPSLLKFWRIDHNLLSYTNVAQQPGNIPVAPGDKTFSEIRTASLDPNSPDFLRPKKKFPLANGGAGGDLPKYAGAVPPAGTKPWDWNVTWRSRMMRAKYQAKRSKKTTESKE